jgi:Polysaccharide pyruvyl transferase
VVDTFEPRAHKQYGWARWRRGTPESRMTGRGAVIRYAYLSVTVRCVNQGNLLIDSATRQILCLDAARIVEFDAHSPLSGEDIDRINACRALVLPGATLLQPEDHPAVSALGQVRCPVLALGVALRSILDVPDVAVARHVSLPVGSRDPFTHRSLRQAGIASLLVGCQTLFFGCAQQWRRQDGPILVILGLGDQRPLERCALACAELGPTVVLAQAPGWQREVFDHPNVTVEAITGTDQTLALLGTAAVVVTGRLHILLAAIALGVPVVFMGGWYDSRYSLIEHLRVPVEPPIPLRIRNLAARVLDGTMPPSRCLEVAEQLRQAMRRHVSQVGQQLGLGSPTAGAEQTR